MPIKALQQRLTQVGVIRLGEKRISKNNKPYPAKLETLRFTSPSRPLVDAVAERYGGEVRPWQSPAGPEWEVVTPVKEIPVLVPPQRIDPNNELWGNGFRARLCDGETERIRNIPCPCEQSARQRYAQQGRAWPEDGRFERTKDDCKPTTRMSVMLAEIPSLGTWKLESHGWNAAAELPTLASAIENAPQPIPARLEVQARQKKVFNPRAAQDKQIETRDFMVPVLHFDFVTPAQAFGGQIGSAARMALSSAPVGRQAIGSAPEPAAVKPKHTPEQYVAMARLARNPEQVRALGEDAKADGALTDEVRAALNARWQQLQDAATQPVSAAPAAAEPPVEGEVEPDPDAVWSQINAHVGKHQRWNADELEQQVIGLLGKPSCDASGFELQRFMDALKDGEVPS